MLKGLSTVTLDLNHEKFNLAKECLYNNNFNLPFNFFLPLIEGGISLPQLYTRPRVSFYVWVMFWTPNYEPIPQPSSSYKQGVAVLVINRVAPSTLTNLFSASW